MTAEMVSLSRGALDEMQQRLFAVALGLGGLRRHAADEELALELERLELEVDGLIREIRERAFDRSW